MEGTSAASLGELGVEIVDDRLLLVDGVSQRDVIGGAVVLATGREESVNVDNVFKEAPLLLLLQSGGFNGGG